MPPVLPLILAVCGVAALAGAAAMLRGFGRNLRLAQILASAPEESVAQVAAAADLPDARYVRARGRIVSDEEFPDELDRPLVYRRRRVELCEGRRWRALEDERLAVPFGIEERGAYLGVDLDALGEGLIVLPRESGGMAGEVPDHVPPGTPADRAVRLRVEQISAVEQATVAGVPRRGPDGRPMLTAGAGRPLIVSTLDQDEAMRVLGGGRRARAFVAVGLAAAGLGLVAIAIAGVVVGLAR
jgi:hypothetical protein